MTVEDQIATLFARANPVPSLDLLDPIEPLDVDDLEDRSKRSSVMSDVETIHPTKANRQRWPRVAIGMAIAVIAVAALAFLVNRETVVASPEAVATAFLDANARFDYVAMEELVAPESAIDIGLVRGHDEWEQATGWVFTQLGCEERSSGPDGALVHCPYTLTNPWFEALGLEPGLLEDVYLIDDGLIVSITENPEVGDANTGEAWEAFRLWVIDNHGSDYGTMYGDLNALSKEALALWEQYTEEFVAEYGG